MKKLVAILAAGVLVAGAVATNIWLDLRAEHGKAGELAARVTAAESVRLARASLPQVVAPVLPAAVVTNPPAASEPVAITPVPANPQPDKGAAQPPAKGMLEVMATPEGMDAARTLMRGAMAQLYPDIEKELGLTALEKQQLFDLRADGGSESTDLLLGGAKDPAARREMQRKLVEAERAREEKIAALLGSKYPKWESYQSTAAARVQVKQLRQSLSVSGNPLSENQAEQLVTAFATEGQRSDKENRAWTTSSAAINSPNMMQETIRRAVEAQTHLVDVAAHILEPAQLDGFKRQVEQQATILRATMSMIDGGGAP